MNNTYQIALHADGYQVIATGATVGISTHASILDALAACRAANRFIRNLQPHNTRNLQS
jgi:hypothetical protein